MAEDWESSVLMSYTASPVTTSSHSIVHMDPQARVAFLTGKDLREVVDEWCVPPGFVRNVIHSSTGGVSVVILRAV